MSRARRHHVVIIGGGFGGLNAAFALRRADVQVTLIDRRNFHLFQPLLYQVATGGLSPADIAYPLRGVFRRHRNVRTLLGEVAGLDLAARQVRLRDASVPFDTLVVAAGSRECYFGHEEWSRIAPGLKTVEQATRMRRRILGAFEAVEREPDPERRTAWLNFVIVGAGPTGVELSGALAELARETLRHDFRRIDPGGARVILLDMSDRLLPGYPPELSAKAARALHRLGVTFRPGCRVVAIEEAHVRIEGPDGEERIPSRTVLWTAGVQASPLTRLLHEHTGAPIDKTGRIEVQPDCTLAGRPDVFVIGDMARFMQDGAPLPGLAPVAVQQGRYVGKAITDRLQGGAVPPFRYSDRGQLAVIGRNQAVADLGGLRLSGFPAWLLWLFVHLMQLVGFQNRVLVGTQWAFNYFTRKRSARMITHGQEEES